MTVFYAAAAGMSIVTTRIRGAADYLQEPENCLWTEPRNATMLSEKIAFLLKNQETRRNMSQANRELARNFSAALVTREYLEVYSRIASADE